MRKDFENLLVRAFGIVALAWILFHLILIAIYGEIVVYEPNGTIVAIEIAFTSMVLVVSIDKLFRSFKKIHSGRRGGKLCV